ncbi:unnamed protein product [Chrysoparadoxa australica]
MLSAESDAEMVAPTELVSPTFSGPGTLNPPLRDILDGEGARSREKEIETVPLLHEGTLSDGEASVEEVHDSESEAIAKGWAHKLPPAPQPMDYILYIPLGLRCYVKRLTDVFGWRFIALVVAVYGLSQGLGEELMSMGSLYFLKDERGFQPAQSELVSAIGHAPWNIKPLYGLASDLFPIYGLHRTPYIIAAGTLGTLSWLSLAGLPPISLLATGGLFFLANLSIASPDVMIDATVAEHCRTRPSFAADLQTLCWGSLAAGGIMGCAVVGYMEEAFGPRSLFLLACLTSLSVMLPAAIGWLGEQPKASVTGARVLSLGLPGGAVRSNVIGQAGCCRDVPEAQRHLFLLAIGVALSAVILAWAGNSAMGGASQGLLGGVTLAVATVIGACTYYVLNRISPVVAKPALFIFLRASLQPSMGSVLSYWYTDYSGGPLFSAEFMGALDCVAYVAMMVGVSVYNGFMSHWSFRKIFFVSQLVLTVLALSDLVLFTRTNLRWGISDKVFVLGEEAFAPLVAKFFSMPMFILAAKVCPRGIEATLFSLLMSLSNFGSDIGRYLGIAMVNVLNLNRENYDNLPLATCIKSVFKVAIIMLIPLLVPDAKPSDDLLPKEAKGDSDDFEGGNA